MRTRLFIFMLSVALTLPLMAQQNGGFGIKIGMFSPDGDYMEKWYGDITNVGFVYLHPLGDRVNIEYGMEYMRKGGDDFIFYDEDFDADIFGDSNIEMVPLTLTIRFQPCTKTRFCPYVGAGIGYYFVEEELDYEVYDYVYDEYYRVIESSEANLLGIHAVVGFDAIMRSGGAFMVEAKWSSVEGEIWEEDIDFGGLTASVGYRFGF